MEILSQLKKVSQRLDMVEDQVAGGGQQATQATAGSPETRKLSTDSVIASSHKSSKRLLIPPSTQVVCLGVLIDTERGTVSIPPEKLRQINDMVKEWLTKKTCTKR